VSAQEKDKEAMRRSDCAIGAMRIECSALGSAPPSPPFCSRSVSSLAQRARDEMRCEAARRDSEARRHRGEASEASEARLVKQRVPKQSFIWFLDLGITRVG
jgi:hypothetical protein